MCFSKIVSSSVLPEGKSFLYTNISYSTSEALWIKGDEARDYTGAADILGNEDRGTRNYTQFALKGYYGLGSQIQLGAGIRYGMVEQVGAPILGAEKGG